MGVITAKIKYQTPKTRQYFPCLSSLASFSMIVTSVSLILSAFLESRSCRIPHIIQITFVTRFVNFLAYNTGQSKPSLVCKKFVSLRVCEIFMPEFFYALSYSRESNCEV